MLARTSLVFPILRLVTRPADSARSISRCTELTATVARAESSVRLASSSGVAEQERQQLALLSRPQDRQQTRR